MSDAAGRGLGLGAAAIALAAVAVASLAIGAQNIAPAEVWRALVDPSGTDAHLIVREVRVPRTVIGICVGAALAISGALVQTLTRNPLAEPGILGVSAGAAFVITVGASLGLAGSQAVQMLLAMLGAAAAAVVVYAVGRTSPLRLVLAGVALSAVLAGVTLGMRLINPDVFDRYRFWAVGSLAGREQLPLALPVTAIVVALAATALIARPLEALALGEQVAGTLGVHIVRTRVIVLLLVTVLAGVATALAGPIAFVGLLVPHVARRFAAGSIPWLLGFSLALGPVLLVGSDVISRILLPTGEVPVAIVTAFIGAPALIWAVRRYGTVAL